MSRVLLFVQNGSGLPACRCAATRFAGGARNARRRELASSGFYVWHWHEKAALEAARWWLVECGNAEAGRTLIALTEMVGAARRYVGASESDPVMFTGQAPVGRILASGGSA